MGIVKVLSLARLDNRLVAVCFVLFCRVSEALGRVCVERVVS